MMSSLSVEFKGYKFQFCPLRPHKNPMSTRSPQGPRMSDPTFWDSGVLGINGPPPYIYIYVYIGSFCSYTYGRFYFVPAASKHLGTKTAARFRKSIIDSSIRPINELMNYSGWV